MDDAERRHMHELLLSYIGLLATRNEYAPGDFFDFDLWDDLAEDPPRLRLLSNEEAEELTFLARKTDSWATYDLESLMFKIIGLGEWMELLEKRGH
jgi:hypothetical protein